MLGDKNIRVALWGTNGGRNARLVLRQNNVKVSQATGMSNPSVTPLSVNYALEEHSWIC